MDITYESIIEQCKTLSSFEGSRLTDAQGESLYPIVRITEQDEPLIKSYAEQAVEHIHASARYAIGNVSYSDATKITLTYNAGNALGNVPNDTAKVLNECIAMYVMQKWLENKSEERAKAYELMFTNLLATFKMLAHNKPKPSLSNYA